MLEEIQELTTAKINGKTGFESMTNVHVDCTQTPFFSCGNIGDPSYTSMDITWDEALYTMERVKTAMHWFHKHILEMYDFPYIVLFYTNEKT
jgi:hypothetical protein